MNDPSRLASPISMWSPRGQMCSPCAAIPPAAAASAGKLISLYPDSSFSSTNEQWPASRSAYRSAEPAPSAPTSGPAHVTATSRPPSSTKFSFAVAPLRSTPTSLWPKCSATPAASARLIRNLLRSYREIEWLYSLSSLPYRWKTGSVPSRWMMRPVTFVPSSSSSAFSAGGSTLSARSPRTVATRLIERPADGMARMSPKRS